MTYGVFLTLPSEYVALDRAGYPYVFLDGIYLKRSWGGEVRNVSVLVAIGIGLDGFREILGVSAGAKEDKASWASFLRQLKKRGLKGEPPAHGRMCERTWTPPSSVLSSGFVLPGNSRFR